MSEKNPDPRATLEKRVAALEESLSKQKRFCMRLLDFATSSVYSTRQLFELLRSTMGRRYEERRDFEEKIRRLEADFSPFGSLSERLTAALEGNFPGESLVDAMIKTEDHQDAVWEEIKRKVKAKEPLGAEERLLFGTADHSQHDNEHECPPADMNPFYTR